MSSSREIVVIIVVVCAGCASTGQKTEAEAKPLKALPDEWPVTVDRAARAALPPVAPFRGKSGELVVAADHPWVTPAEASGLTRSPTYDQTLAYLRRLCAAAPELALVDIGRSPQGRTIWMVVASLERASSPEALRAAGKPTLLAQAGIHAGEIDGKDAGLMLLRDLTVRPRQRALLQRANLLLIPILSVDGHERASRFSRPNQRGPARQGWRTNARNLNLNRDFAKLDAPETRAVVSVLDRWRPDLWLDVHVTDGIDYQYDITYGFNGPHGYSPAISGWLGKTLSPALDRALRGAGHLPGPLIFAVKGDPKNGLVEWTASPRFTNGYGDARHLATVLVENHSLKPYDQRVLGTYVLLAEALRTLGGRGAALRAAAAADRRRAARRVPLGFKTARPARETIDFAGVAVRFDRSPISGEKVARWLGRPLRQRVPRLRQTEVIAQVTRPRAYWIPPGWSDLIARLERHGVRLERLTAPRELTLTMYRIRQHSLASEAYEGRVRVEVKRLSLERRRERIAAGGARVPTDQPLGDLAMLLLEPRSRDSFFAWGMMLSVLQRTEYIEPYVIEPLARRMLARDPQLKRAFARRLASDAAFAADPKARLRWFYRRTRYYDDRYLLYPIGRED